MKSKLIIIEVDRFFDFEKNCPSIGGVQTYVQNLADLGKKLDFDVHIFLLSKNKNLKKTTFKGCIIQTIHKKQLFKSLNQSCYNYIVQNIANKNDKIVIMRDDFLIKNLTTNTFVIQHGITFDIPGYCLNSVIRKSKILSLSFKILACLKNALYVYHTKNLVCVDYNFYNWFRTIGSIYQNQKVLVIPNFSSDKISEESFFYKINKTTNIKKIVFARRLVTWRGTLLFADVVFKLLNERNDIDITFAGTGILENDLKNRFKGFKNVHFTSYAADESIKFHSKFDIAVVPTIWSEGTSLSALEAMSAGCLPITTCVGGLSNIIIDNYNGKITEPSYNSFYDTLNDVLNLSQEEFIRIQKNAYFSATEGFGKSNWENKWARVLS